MPLGFLSAVGGLALLLFQWSMRLAPSPCYRQAPRTSGYRGTRMALYFVTMDIDPDAEPQLPVNRLASVVREAILPTVEALIPLSVGGKLATGGYLVGERTMVFVFEADSEEEVREVLEGLPLSGVVTPNIRPMRTLGEIHALDDEF
jgi:Muconolactone delta-isomerase